MKVLIHHTRDVDLAEIIARSPVADNPIAEITLYNYLHASLFSWTGSVDDKVACIWGLVAPSILSESAYLWLLTTDTVEEHKFCFVRHSQIMVKEMLKHFPLITGQVLAGQDHSVNWLKWLGVTFGDHIVEGDRAFINFELRRA